MNARRRARLLGVALAASASLACAGAPPRSAAASHAGKPVVFSYGTPSGEILSSDSTRGRVTVLLFVTTFDLPSQLMAKRLEAVAHRHRPRSNAGAVVLEPPNSAPLVDVFKTSLALSYPVALTNSTRMGERGPFGDVDQVPVLVVLDKRGVEVARATGVVTEREIDEALARAER